MKGLLFLFLFLVIAALVGCDGDEKSETPLESEQLQTAEHHEISAEEARKIMNDGGEFILIDVRTQNEYNENRIDGAVLIPDYEIKERAFEAIPDKKARILIYCRSGRRSAIAAKELADMGYTDVYDFGGIIDWPYDTVKS
ncbi:MAG: rhodanese-like domain-containing protein [Clostridiales bacterium]|jgi:rhodanese-related sulfurtransferase|nr:rhodanese-like domain-containing protein [Clostridiales bacterium]